MTNSRNLIRCVVCFLTILWSAAFSRADVLSDTTILRVGIKEAPPFIIKNLDGSYNGLSLELWNEISRELHLKYVFKEYKLLDMLDAVENGEIDICITPLPVTEDRIRKFDFTQPYYITSMGVATVQNSGINWKLILNNIFSLQLLKVVGMLFTTLLIFGTFMWLVERRQNGEFISSIHGLFDGIWWAAVTMTTVGYGDKTPKTFLGKMVSLIWMFAAIIMISFFTASITSTLTVNSLEMQIETLKDLKKFKTIGTVHASGSDYFLKNNNMQDLVRIKKYWTPDDGLKALGKGHIGAFIYDEPILKFLESHNDYGEELQVLTHLFNKQYYGFIMPKGSPLLDKINPVLIEKINDQAWKNHLNAYDLKQ